MKPLRGLFRPSDLVFVVVALALAALLAIVQPPTHSYSGFSPGVTVGGD